MLLSITCVVGSSSSKLTELTNIKESVHQLQTSLKYIHGISRPFLPIEAKRLIFYDIAISRSITTMRVIFHDIITISRSIQLLVAQCQLGFTVFSFDISTINQSNQIKRSRKKTGKKELRGSRGPLDVWKLWSCSTNILGCSFFWYATEANNRLRLDRILIKGRREQDSHQADGRQGRLLVLAFIFDWRAIPFRKQWIQENSKERTNPT